MTAPCGTDLAYDCDAHLLPTALTTAVELVFGKVSGSSPGYSRRVGGRIVIVIGT